MVYVQPYSYCIRTVSLCQLFNLILIKYLFYVLANNANAETGVTCVNYLHDVVKSRVLDAIRFISPPCTA